jgi:hypothetical protein
MFRPPISPRPGGLWEGPPTGSLHFDTAGGPSRCPRSGLFFRKKKPIATSGPEKKAAKEEEACGSPNGRSGKVLPYWLMTQDVFRAKSAETDAVRPSPAPLRLPVRAARRQAAKKKSRTRYVRPGKNRKRLKGKLQCACNALASISSTNFWRVFGRR